MPIYRPPGGKVQPDNAEFTPGPYQPPTAPPMTEAYHISPHDVPRPTKGLNATCLSGIAHQHLGTSRAEYAASSVTEGFLTRCQRPRVTIVERNHVEPDTPEGDKWDEQLAEMGGRGLIFSADQPVLPGTQTLAAGCAVKFTWPDKTKLRPTVDGSLPNDTSRTSRSAWTPINELRYSTQRIYHVIALCLAHDIGSASIEDYVKAFTQLYRHPNELALNCVFWRGQYHYSWGCFYGESSTPFNAELVFDLVQTHTDSEIQRVLGARHPLARRVDDTLLLHPRGLRHTATDALAVLKHVTAKAGLSLQTDKEIVDQEQVEFDGYVLAFNRPNIHGPPGAIGIMDRKARQLESETGLALSGKMIRKDAEAMVGRMEHLAVAIIQVAPLLPSLHASIHANPNRGAKVQWSTESRSDLQRWQEMLRETLGASLWCPFFHHFAVTEPVADIYTDGSGNQGAGGHTTAFWYSEPWETRMRISMIEPGFVDNSTWAEVVALYYMLEASRNLFDGGVVRWCTDSDASAHIQRKVRAKNPRINRVVKLIALWAQKHSVAIICRWLPRAQNKLADMLSKGETRAFLSQIAAGRPAADAPRQRSPSGAAKRKVVQSL